MTKCQCVHCSTHQDSSSYQGLDFGPRMPNAAFGIICMSKVLQMSLDWPCGSGPALFYTAMARASICCPT